MRRLAAVFLAAIAIAPAEAAAQASDVFCRDLEQVIAATRDDPPFHILANGRARPPEFGFDDGCQLAGSTANPVWACHQQLAPEGLRRDRLAERIQACRPEATREQPAWGVVRLVLPGLSIHISELGGPRAHVGRTVSMFFEAAP